MQGNVLTTSTLIKVRSAIGRKDMMNMTMALYDTEEVHVALKDRIVRVNLAEELRIDTDDIIGEVLTQPSKIAMWSVLHKLAEHKVRMAGCDSDALRVALRDKELIANTLEAFNHKKSALMRLWANPEDTEVLTEYQNILYHMGVPGH